MKPFIIQIFCQKREICSLLKKKLRADGYYVECINVAEAETDFLDGFNKHIDCIILDKDIDIQMRDMIRSRFAGVPIVCLPSLDAETIDSKDVTYISEPLKMSELSEIINEIRIKKEVETDS